MIQGHHGLFQRSIGIEPMRIKNIYIIDPHPLKTLIAACDQIFTASPFPIRSGPHIITRLGGNHQFITMAAEVFPENSSESNLRTPSRRPVIICQVKMCNAQIESLMTDCLFVPVSKIVSEIMPQTQ